jgi:PAS domain S-box-containing protein
MRVTRHAKDRKYLYAEMMLEHMPVGAAIYDVQDWRLLEANPRFLAYLDTCLKPHWQHGCAIGHPVTELDIQLQTASIVEIFRSVGQSGIPYRGDAMAIYTAQGALTFWNWTLDPLCDEDGQIRYLLHTVTDATVLVQARRQAERVRLSTVLDQLPEGVLIADAIAGSITYANPAVAHLLGIELDRLIGSPVSHIFQGRPVGDSSLFTPWNFFLIQALSGETITSKETVVVHSDGKKVVMLISGAPLYGSTGIMIGAVLVLRDITAQKSIEQQKNEFLWMANHELRTPVTIIQGFAELLKSDMIQKSHLSESARAALANIIEQSEHLSRLIDAMLDMSRIEQEQFELHLAQHDLRDVLAHVIESQAITTTRHHLRFILEGLQETEPLMGTFDKEQMVQVLSNLINNAIKYSPQGGDIGIGLRAIADPRHPGRYREAMIWVKDQGIGIAVKDIPHIFERFYRSSTIDRSLSGLGIGLHIVKEVVARHEGRVWVESVQGSGSTFYVWLPLYARNE